MKYIILILLTSCASKPTQPPMPPKEVLKVVTEKCVTVSPDMPKLHTSKELKAMSEYAFITAIHADRLALDIYAKKLSALVDACK